jgi:hypothetical protein
LSSSRSAGSWIAIAGLDRKRASLALDQGSRAQQPADACPVDCRRHDDQPQVVPQRRRVEGERQSQVGVEAALVELVEQHRGNAAEFGIVEQHAGEHALRHYLDTGARRDPRVEPHPVADRRPHLLAEALCHPARRGPCRQPARFEHDDAAVPTPGRGQQAQRHAGGLAGPGRGDEHGGAVRRQRLMERRQGVVDGQRNRRHGRYIGQNGRVGKPVR